MTWPMIILAVGSAALGGVLMIGGTFATWLEPVTGHVEHHEPVLPIPVIMVATLALVLAGAFLAWRQYAASAVPVVPPRGTVLTRAARVDLYQEVVNQNVFQRPGQYLTRSLVYADKKVVDGGFMGFAGLLGMLGIGVKRLQNGYVRSYAAMMLAGFGVLVVVVLSVWN
jgi:NADH-quinone oxidoreductase subunit L